VRNERPCGYLASTVFSDGEVSLLLRARVSSDATAAYRSTESRQGLAGRRNRGGKPCHWLVVSSRAVRPPSFHGITERPGVFADSVVTRYD
jgi:hypothetical protein